MEPLGLLNLRWDRTKREVACVGLYHRRLFWVEMHQNDTTVKRCFDVTNALLAASAQLNAVSAVSGLATLEKPSIERQ
jgi:hypothetical protein